MRGNRTVEIKPEHDSKTCVRYTISGTAGGACDVVKAGTCQVVQ